MARERDPDVVPEADEADVEEQHHPVSDGDDDDTPTAQRVPMDAPEADVLEQHQVEPDDDDYE